MDPATLVVLVLTAGVIALVVWFEINSRRNQARKKQVSDIAQSDLGPLQKNPKNQVESEIDKTNAA
jgi:hypothetical protein